MRILIDSNRFIDFCAGEESVVEVFETASRLFVPFVVLGEIQAGAALLKRGQTQLRVLIKLLNQPGVTLLQSTEATTTHYGTLYAAMRRAGTPIPTNDLWIAALALEHHLVLYTRDAHFRKIHSLALFP